ncbi:Hpt domain-containing protein [Thauera sp.]|jgi:chemosensory pili system protein ChpA (sensor histidine kinase/response regulator)|uniref:hybrid sensor histidine kinase/response regulator n=1 Tax=Thauera sp. TaxID=1905334 RepID=UPI002A3670F0|nr:Hpt domain-containing protein [Thauera sp.]MDX9886414.1 Hpt domain-containing protein [Thauera sp.]
MKHATAPDLGPLTWVKGEIDAALSRASEILDRDAAEADPSGLQFAQTHLHQVRGALAIVGLDGLTQFADTLEKLLGDMAHETVPADAPRRTLVRRSLAVIGNYLEELAHGAPDQALRLAGPYMALAAARGQADASPADLFHPDLSRRPPARAEDATAADPDAAAQILRSARSRFERGLLDWLRKGAAGEGARAMREAIADVEAQQHNPSARSLWWASLAFYDALIDGSLAPEPGVKRLCTQIDAQFRRLLSGTPTVPDRLLRELLYQIAQCPANSAQQRAVRECWQLDALLPEAGASVSGTPTAPLLDTLTRHLASAREQWDDFCAGTAVALTRFEDAVEAMEAPAAALERPATQALVAGILGFARWLRRDPLQCSEATAMEGATALLLLEAGLERRPPEAGFGARVDAMLPRLQALQRGELPLAGAADDVLGVSTPAQDKALLEQLAKEMLSSLGHVEQALDDFFRNPARRDPLLLLHQPLQQIIGALSVLGETDALALVRDAAVHIASLAKAESSAGQAEFEALAHQLSALGFYIEALPRGGAALHNLLGIQPQPSAVSPAAALEEAQPARTTELISPPGREDIAAILPEAPPEATPDIAPGASDVVLTLPRDEVAPEPGIETDPQAPAPDRVPATSDDEDSGITLLENLEDLEDLTELEPAPTAAAVPGIPAPAAASAASAQPPAGAADDAEIEAEVDAELLGIFIEEAIDVLATLRARLEGLRANPTETDDLVTIRRGFHTLKGSGRMVGLTQLGDTAWAVEQTLNRWLQLDWPVTPALLSLIETGDTVFSAWIARLQAGQPGAVDTSHLEAEAERLRNASEAPTACAPAPRVAQTPAVAAAAAAEASPAERSAVEASPLEARTSQPVSVVFPTIEDRVTAESPPAERYTHDELSELDELEDLEELTDLADLEVPALDEPAAADVELPAIPAPEAEPRAAQEDETTSPALDLLFESADFLIDGELGEQPPPAAETALQAAQAHTPEEGAASAASGEEAPPPAAQAPELVQIGDVELARALYELYCAEAAQHLDTLDAELHQLQVVPQRPPASAAVRAAHTLAGISGTARLPAAHQLARALEHALDRLADRGDGLQAEALAVLASVVRSLRDMLADVLAARLPNARPDLIAALEAALAAERNAAPCALPTHTGLAATPDTAATVAPPPAPPATPAAIAHQPAAETTPADDIDSELLPIFLEEAAETASALHAMLRRWRGEPDNGEHARSVARLLHSLKGSARMAGAMNLGAHLHQLESRLEDGVSAHEMAATLVDALALGLDRCEQMIDALALGDSGEAPAAAGEPAAAAAAAPSEDARSEETEALSSPTLRVRAELVDRFVNQAGEIGVARSRINGELRTLRRSLLDLTENVIRLRSQLREVEIQAEVQMQSRIAQAGAQQGDFDPLELDRYTRLQELTRMMAESVNDVTTVQQNLLQNLDGADLALNSQARMARELQQGLMQVRMLPFDSLASRLYRVVRQSARELGKRATLDVRGGRIEIDRSVLEQMAAPLEHLLRNAVAHGIEAPAERAAAGKPESGCIELTVSQEGNEIAIEIADDGAGIDLERIAARARERGLIGADEQPDERRLTNLIFVSGFSTARELSAVSGRGVGMDVVKAQTAAAGGRVDVSSRRGGGTRFNLRLPLTLAVTQALLVQAGGRTWAVPSNMVVQAMELKPDALRTLQDEHGIDWQGERFPYRYLARLLGDREARPLEQRYNWVLLLRAGAQTLALHVDGLRGNQEIIVKNAGPQLTRIIGMSGATVLGDGEIVLILNPVALASRSLAQEDAEDDTLAPAGEAPPPLRLPTVMVVDDSLTVRKITGRLLEREGYRVITAKDGVDALEQLIDTVPDVVLSDIEMPRMDGFDLVRNIRADARLKHLPVIMITSRLAEKHRSYAEEVGASHYLGKPYQEEELLGLVAGYTQGLVQSPH